MVFKAEGDFTIAEWSARASTARSGPQLPKVVKNCFIASLVHQHEDARPSMEFCIS
jgi:hypothetical protein